jgi:hypothetical protein
MGPGSYFDPNMLGLLQAYFQQPLYFPPQEQPQQVGDVLDKSQTFRMLQDRSALMRLLNPQGLLQPQPAPILPMQPK